MCLLAFLLTGFAASAGAAITPKHSKKFQKLDDCRLIPKTYNDGDSFRVAVGADEFVFRLYYVDTPESDTRFPLRNAEQAQHFAITPEKSVEMGKEAGKFVTELLGAKPFTVHTRWAYAQGSSAKSRYYAVVIADGRDLSELLVEKGLARVHGVTVNHPSGVSGIEHVAKLHNLEVKAKDTKQGAWAFSDPKNLPPEPDVLEVTEVEIPRGPNWTERLLSGGVGGAFVGLLWLLTSVCRRKPLG